MNLHGDPATKAALEVTRRRRPEALGYFEAVVAVELEERSEPRHRGRPRDGAGVASSLQRLFPGDGFLGEEYGVVPGTSGFRWVARPHRRHAQLCAWHPLVATLVDWSTGEQIAGVRQAPALGQTWHALRGAGPFGDAKPIPCLRTWSELSESLLFYSSLSWFVRRIGRTHFWTWCAGRSGSAASAVSTVSCW